MKLSLSIPVLFFFSAFLHAQAQLAQPLKNSRSIKFIVGPSDTLYRLPDEFIVEGSERIFPDSDSAPLGPELYVIDYRYGKIYFTREQIGKILRGGNSRRITINYKILPLHFKEEYSLRRLEVIKDSTGGEKKMIVRQQSVPFSEDFFGPGLQKSGSIIRGFSLGSNQDLTLSSGFRMQLAGKLSQDIDVTAALTDENSPIQPEGTTQTLREVDKVYVEIKHPNYTALLGDFSLQVDRKDGGEFGRIDRKLQGGKGTASFQQTGGSELGASFSFTGATARGKYATNQFQGIDGVQGPYRLTGQNGEDHLLVIAGSERVYLNGEMATRGETNDYVIDYSSGEITFSAGRLITNASRITVDFEYSDQQYTRNLVASAAKGTVLGDKFKLNASFIQEADDMDSPINMTLDDNMRNILRNSGTDRLRASLSGITFVGRDSLTGLGRGQYAVRDTMLAGKTYPILVYIPGDSDAVFTVIFSPVDQVPPDSAGYNRVAAGEYRFAGIGTGKYLPVTFLPMPQLHRVFDFNGEAAIGSDLSFSGEYALSSLNPNRFAAQIQNGNAYSFTLKYNPKEISIGGSKFGEADIRISDRFVNRWFAPMDRSNEVEFSRKWDLSAPIATANEEIREVAFDYRPVKNTGVGMVYGSLDRPGEIRSTRTQISLGISDSTLPVANYRIEQINASNNLLSSESQWMRQRGTVEYGIAGWRPGFRVETEKRKAITPGTDSILQGSFSFLEIAPRIATPELYKMTASAELQIRSDDSASAGRFSRASHSLTQFYTWQVNDRRSISSSLALSIRKLEYTDEFKMRGNLNSDALLIRSQTRYTPFRRAIESDLYYEYSNQYSSRLERIFVRVMKGSGNYSYIGDINGNGIMDDGDFEPTRFDGDYIVTYMPSDQLYPVENLKASVRLRLQPERALDNTSGWFNKLIRAISTETYLKVDENSREPDAKQIYLMNFSRFLNSSTTIAGSQQIMQDVYLLENDPELSFRLRYGERYGLTQFVSAVERSFSKERSLRVRSQIVPEIGNQTDFTNKTDRLTASVRTGREFDLNSNSLVSDFSYRPFQNWEIGFILGVMEVVNYFNIKAETADINEQKIRLTQSFPSVGQLKIEFSREEVVLKDVSDPPYEMTSGKAPGKSYLWQMSLDYRITGNIQLSVNYSGRVEGKRSPVHYARMEARAFF